MAPPTCTISGYLRDVTGAPRKGVPVVVRNRHSPMAHGGESWITGSRHEFLTDREGYVSFTLIRGASVYVDFPGRPDLKLVRVVPDLAEVDLVAWLFPYITAILWTEPDATALSVGDTHTLAITAVLSDNTNVTCPPENVTLEISDDAVLEWTGGALRALAAGDATVTLTAVDQSFLETNQTLEGETLSFLDLPEVEFPAPAVYAVT